MADAVVEVGAQVEEKGAKKRGRKRKVINNQPQSAKVIAQAQETLGKLEAQLQEAKKALQKGNETRLKELKAEKTDHLAVIATLDKEIAQIEQALGVAVVAKVDVSDLVDGEADGSPKIKFDAYGKKPKDLDNEDCSLEFWNELMVWPGKSENATMTSLNTFIGLVLYNAGGKSVNTRTVMKAVEAMGHDCSSKTFRSSVGVAFNNLIKSGYAERKERSCYAITKEGKKWVKQVVKDNEASLEEPPKAKAKDGQSLDDAILLALKKSGKLSTAQIANAVTKVGFQFPAEASAQENGVVFRESLTRLLEEKVIGKAVDGKKTQLSLTEAGTERAEALG